MMLLYIIIIAVLVFINPVLGAVGVFLCLVIQFLKDIVFGNSDKGENKHDDVPHTEYDEFDWWQDNQGL